MKYLELSLRQIEIYNNLMKLCSERDAFYFDDFSANEEAGSVFRIFNYRMASYTDFCEPDALECRGICFEISDYDRPIRLVARPIPKFFNCNESPLSMVATIFPSDPIAFVNESLDKADGSLISSYIDTCGQLKLKSKGSLTSDQAEDSMAWIESRTDLYDEVMQFSQAGWTVDFEWCAPHNRIVLPYAVAHLKVLSVRNNDTGEFMTRRDIGVSSPVMKAHLVDLAPLPYADTFADVLDLVRAQTGIEGYIVKFNNGLWVKIKTDAYKSLHHAKDSVNIPRRLFECVVNGASDDLKDMFASDPAAMHLIIAMEDFVRPMYNSICKHVEDFYSKNKDMSQRDFAITAQKELDKKLGEFNLVMALYNGNTVDYKSNLLCKWKTLGLKDEKV